MSALTSEVLQSARVGIGLPDRYQVYADRQRGKQNVVTIKFRPSNRHPGGGKINSTILARCRSLVRDRRPLMTSKGMAARITRRRQTQRPDTAHENAHSYFTTNFLCQL
jgi:hypothetical protein